MQALDDMQTTAMETLGRLLDAAADLRETLQQSAQERRKVDLVRQSLSELEEIKDSFVAIISHELRTPVGVVSNGIELLQRRLDGRLDESEAELLLSVKQQSRQLATLVRELTEFNDLSSGGQLAINEDALRLALDAAVGNVRPQADEHNVAIEVRLPSAVPTFHGDWQRLRVVIENLLANAVRFTPNDGSVEIQVEVHADKLFLSVRDSGAGIPPAQLARIFDSFRQAEEPHTRHYGGLGLGLNIIQRAIYSMGGTITVESQQGVGSTFTVILPLGGDVQSGAPAPNADLRSSLLAHIHQLHTRLDNANSCIAHLEAELDEVRK